MTRHRKLSPLDLASAVVGRASLRSNDAGGHGAACRGIDKGAIPQPAGTHLCQWTNWEISRAEADGFVVYQYEWVEAKPSPFGERHLAEIACQIPKVANAIIVEPSGDSALDEQRRLAVVQAMAQCGVEIPPERVIFGHSQAEGLRGYEAGRVGNQLISGQQGAGANGAGTSGGTGTGGFGNGFGGSGQGATGGFGGGTFGGVVVPAGGGLGGY